MPAADDDRDREARPVTGTLRVRTFGGLQVFRGAVELTPFPTRHSAALFALLVLHRHDSMHRETLCARLWGGQPERVARKSLRTALWRLRRAIETDGSSAEAFLRIGSHRVGVLPDPNLSVDAWTLEDVAASIEAGGAARLSDADVRAIESATSLYRGRLLEGEHFVDEWILAESARLERLQIALLERLMLHHRTTTSWLPALSTGFEILRLDNCHERVHREIMTCFAALGDRPAAIRHFDECSTTLARELGIRPMRETIELNERIRAGSLDVSVLAPDRRDAPLGAVR